MSKFLKGIKGVEKKVVTPQDIDDIAERLHAKMETKSEFISVAESIKPVAKTVVKTTIIEKPQEPKEELHRLTIDIPEELFQQMKKDTKRKGQTIKGFIVSMIYDFYEK